MKKVSTLKLSVLSLNDLEKRKMNKLLGGGNCCICTCGVILSTLDTGNAGNQSGVVHPAGGYGSGSFG